MAKKKGQAAQDFLLIKSIRDGVVILENGQHCMVLLASSLNFALKSREEQEAIVFQFQQFLNSLDFTAQIYVQSRRLDIRPYLNILDERMRNEINDLMKIQIREYIQFIKNFTETQNIMTKSFFVIVPFMPGIFQTGSGGKLSEKLGIVKTNQDTGEIIEHFEEYRSQLEQRAAVVSQGLVRFQVRSVLLGTEELIELFYRLYNPGEQSALSK
ncbi:MAG: hypothetical protein Q8Q18_02200 [bacterium]|nr:hypothetical protein [bacterium]